MMIGENTGHCLRYTLIPFNRDNSYFSIVETHLRLSPPGPPPSPFLNQLVSMRGGGCHQGNLIHQRILLLLQLLQSGLSEETMISSLRLTG